MRALRAVIYTITATALVLVATAAMAQQLSGTGEWQSLTSKQMKGAWTASLTRQGSTLQGTLSLSGSNVLSGGPVSGSIDSSNVVLGVETEGSRQATFSGTLQGGSISGEWDLNSEVLTDHGVWTGRLAATTQ